MDLTLFAQSSIPVVGPQFDSTFPFFLIVELLELFCKIYYEHFIAYWWWSSIHV